MKKILALTLVLVMVLGSFTSIFADEVSFTDVKEGKWYYDDVMALANAGGINGYPDGTFKPNGTITAAEFVKITVAIVSPVDGSAGTGKDWYKPYAEKAAELGIVPDGMFEGAEWNKPITREKMSVIMELTAQKVLNEDTLDDREKLNYLKDKFSDYDQICEYCKDYVVQAIARGLLEGYPNGEFKPQGNATRAEASTMLVRLVADGQRLVVSYGGTETEIKNKGNIHERFEHYDSPAYKSDDPAKYNLKFDKCYINWDGEPITWFYYYSCGTAYAVLKDGTEVQGSLHMAHNEVVNDFFDAHVNDIEYIVISDRNNYVLYVYDVEVAFPEAFK